MPRHFGAEKRYDAAYYLAGYAIECALKAWIAKQTPRHGFPDKDRANRAHQHRFTELLALIADRDRFDTELRGDPRLEDDWSNVQSWSPASRYQLHAGSRIEVRDMLKSVEGILKCLSRYW